MRYHSAFTLALSVIYSVGACASASSSSPPPSPSVPSVEVPDRAEPGTMLRFATGLYTYRLTQTAEIEAEDSPDTVPVTIATQALVHAVVSSSMDSTISVAVSFDSVSVTTGTPIPPSKSTGAVVRLDSLLTVTFSQPSADVRVRLPDSLCAYGHLIGIARELILPEVGKELESGRRQVFQDTATYNTCRAGAPIEIRTTRELKEVSAGQLETVQQTELRGTGTVRRDSLSVSGSVTAHGSISFGPMNRLPNTLTSQSDGVITVHLGAVRTVFRQRSRHELRQALP